MHVRRYPQASRAEFDSRKTRKGLSYAEYVSAIREHVQNFHPEYIFMDTFSGPFYQGVRDLGESKVYSSSPRICFRCMLLRSFPCRAFP